MDYNQVFEYYRAEILSVHRKEVDFSPEGYGASVAKYFRPAVLKGQIEILKAVLAEKYEIQVSDDEFFNGKMIPETVPYKQSLKAVFSQAGRADHQDDTELLSVLMALEQYLAKRTKYNYDALGYIEKRSLYPELNG